MSDDISKYAVGALVSLLMFSIATAWMAFFPRPVPGPAVEILNMEAPDSVCSGTEDVVNVTFDILKASVLDVHVVYQALDNPLFTHEPVQRMARGIFPVPEVSERILRWVVPTLEPGVYKRVISITSHHAGRAPTFIQSQVTAHPAGDCPLLD